MKEERKMTSRRVNVRFTGGIEGIICGKFLNQG